MKRSNRLRHVVDVPLPAEVVMGAMDCWPANPQKHACLYCGCPSNKMPMVFRGTGWCCENHRKEQEEWSNDND